MFPYGYNGNKSGIVERCDLLSLALIDSSIYVSLPWIYFLTHKTYIVTSKSSTCWIMIINSYRRQMFEQNQIQTFLLHWIFRTMDNWFIPWRDSSTKMCMYIGLPGQGVFNVSCENLIIWISLVHFLTKIAYVVLGIGQYVCNSKSHEQQD